MNCSETIKSLGFRCKEVGERTVRVWSPVTYGNDGQVVALYIEESTDGYLVTDNAEALMHAAAMGVKMNHRRIESLQRCGGGDISISIGGEIRAVATKESLSGAIVGVINAAMAVSHFETSWTPRSASREFASIVGKVLEDVAGDRLLRDVTVTGASGHQIEIPFVVDSGTDRTYVQPVAYGDDRVNWDNVYRAFGKMYDLKNAGADEKSRVV